MTKVSNQPSEKDQSNTVELEFNKSNKYDMSVPTGIDFWEYQRDSRRLD